MRKIKRRGRPAGAFLSAVAAGTAGAAWTPCAQGWAAEAAPLAAFGRHANLEDVVISPDGNKIAFVKTYGDSRTLAVAAVTRPEMLGGVRVGEVKLRSLSWIDDDNLLVTTSSTSLPPYGFTGATREWFQIVNFDISKHKLDELSFKVHNLLTFNVITDSPSLREVSGRVTLYAPGYCVHDRTVSCLFAFGYPDRHARLVTEAGGPGAEWLLDENGNIAAESTYNDAKQLWEIKTHTTGHWAVAASGTAAIDAPRVLGFSADGRGMIVRFVVNGDSQWKTLNLADNSWGPPLEKSALFSSVIEDRKTGRIIGGIREIGSSEYFFFDNELQAHWNAVLREFPDERVRLVSHSDDFSRMVLTVFGPKDGYVYALYDWNIHRSMILGRVYEQVREPAETKAIDYKAADGLDIPAFLTLPAGSRKDLPLVVLPHGGPAAADTLDFDWWSQALAAQGYAVLQPNFRGSILNSSFMEAGYGEWGRKNANRSVGRRALSRTSRHHRSEAGLHRRGELRWICGPRRRDFAVRRLSLRRLGCRHFGFAPVPQMERCQPRGLDAALLGPVHGDGGSERPGADCYFADRTRSRGDGARAARSRPRRYHRSVRAKRCHVQRAARHRKAGNPGDAEARGPLAVAQRDPIANAASHRGLSQGQ